MDDIKNKLLQLIPIENYVSRFVSLKKQGRYLVGLCPFHHEKTPSFTITPEKGIFYCFGCGKGGNLITFVMEKENVSFKEALEILANYAGIKISKSKTHTDNKYIKLLEDINKHYREFLLSNEGTPYRNYLLNRGVKNDSIMKFQLGASPDKPQWIYHQFQHYEEDLLYLGIIKKTEHQCYDFFRNRIIFPIFNTNSEIIGFGARVIDDSKPKYLNSQESSIFHKGSNLYGINFALNSIKKNDFAIITEGYLDVLGLHQIGIENVVAPLGTSFTEDHKKLITRYTKKIVLMMDGDEAGRNSILKTLVLFEDNLKDIKVLLLPQDIDAFDFSNIILKNEILWNSSDFMEQSIDALDFILLHFMYLNEDLDFLKLKHQSLIDFYKNLKELLNKQTLNSVFNQKNLSEKQQTLEELKNYLSNLRNEFIQTAIIEEISKITNMDLKNFLKIEPTKNKNFIVEEKNLNTNIDKEKEILYIIEREIIGLFLNYPDMIKNFSSEIEKINFYDDVSEYIWRLMNDKFSIINQDFQIKDVLNFLPPTMQKEIIPYFMKEFYKEQSVKTTFGISDNDVINIIKELLIKHRIVELDLLIKNKRMDLQFTHNEDKTYIYYEINKLLKEKKMLHSSLRGSN